MKPYIIALAVGLLVGGLYGLLNVRSPAPPYVALLGLLGILVGEQAVAAIKHSLNPPVASAGAPPAVANDAAD